ncbi:Golgi SNAP receptor complex member 2-like isoform X2 [Anneissia japonica]|uniref:Golgi SNAP receptor complex member 2-like isoform X1 n=1 Tax=Anneissia japonica TaxID=1529436 RepID=UPI0014255B2F|nr:Golgi SNAP receptor complex member 2-like isoform X1 [Anneissia japonica]XP_033104814.1 Golgi SNAP receptor complex member 2-like isoform X2 [Anneissia japonica]
MDNLYHQTNRIIIEVQNGLSRLENTRDENFHTLENEVLGLLERITSNCERLDILVNKEPPSRRQHAKIQVDKLKYDMHHLQTALQLLNQRRQRYQQEARDREELLNRSYTTNDSSAIDMIDHDLKHHTSLRNSINGVNDLIGQGAASMSNLRSQSNILKNTKKRMLDLATTLGLSNTVMRLIEKRSVQDKFILFGGMIVTCIVMIVIYRYFL